MEIKLVNVLKLHRDIFPPYGIALINAFLNNNSIKSDIYDLDVIVKHHNSLDKSSDFVDLGYMEKRYDSIYNLLKQTNVDKYLDLQFDNILKKIDLKNSDVIGLNSHDNEIYVSLYLAKKIKEIKDCTIIIGGSHVTRISFNRLKQLIIDLDINYVDYFVPGHPYDFFLNLYEHKLPLNHKDKAVISENKGVLIDINNYEIPLYNKEHLELYKIDINKINFYYRLNNKLFDKFKDLQEIKNTKPVLVLPFKFMEGCSNNCAFCCFNKGGKTFKLDADIVLSNIKAMGERYDCKDFYFLNNDILMDKEYVITLLKRMSEETDIKWCDCSSINNLDSSTIKLMVDSGCIQLLFGLESASPKLLKYTNKNKGYNKLKYYTRCFKDCDKNGIWVLVDLIAGLPYETEDDIRQTIAYLEKNRKIINGIFINRFILMKKSAFFNNPDAYKLRLIDDSHVQEKMKSKLEKEFDVYHKIYYRTVIFDETGGLKWADKQKQIEQSAKILRNYVSEQFWAHFYFHYPIFFLYEAFQNDKKSIINFLNN